MAMTPATPSTRLGCGRDVDDVWDAIDQPPNEHEQSCPYCTQARTELTVLGQATRDLTAADQQDETLRVPDHMLANVLAIVRIEVRRGRTIPLQRRIPPTPVTGPSPVARPAVLEAAADESLEGSPAAMPELTVSELVIATVVREICDRDPDVEVRRVSIDIAPVRTPPTPSSDRDDRTSEREATPYPEVVEPTEVSIDLQAAVRPATSIPTVMTRLRAAIQEAVQAQIGIAVSRIDVDVQDLIDA